MIRITLHRAKLPLPLTHRCYSAKSYMTISTPTRTTTVEKGSRFVAMAWGNIHSPEQAMALIRQQADSAATHNCFAYKIGDITRSSDDGEPAGTAGRPILAAIQGEKLDHVACLVTRFYGGTKLGTGGLVRAYGDCARTCLRGAPRIERESTVSFELGPIPFRSLALIYSLMDRWGGGRSSEEEYDQDGNATVVVSILASKEEEFLSSVRDIMSGSGDCIRHVQASDEGKS